MEENNFLKLLSRRQYQIGVLLADGYNVKSVCRMLEMSRTTYNYHMFNLRQKFGCSNNYQLGYEMRPILDELTEFLNNHKKATGSNPRWPNPYTNPNKSPIETDDENDEDIEKPSPRYESIEATTNQWVLENEVLNEP